jgi:hypothetical protein
MQTVVIFLVLTVVLPIVITKTTERGRFDFIHPWLREIWMVLLVLGIWYVLEQPLASEFIMRHRDGKLAYLIVFLVGGLLLCLFWWLMGAVLQEKPKEGTLARQVDPFAVEVEPIIKGSGWFFVAQDKQILIPAGLVAFVTLRNQQSNVSMVSRLGIQVLLGNDWVALHRIDTRRLRTVYFALPNRTQAKLLDMPLLDTLLDNKNLANKETQRGWTLFFNPVGRPLPEFSYLRVTVDDVAGAHWTSEPLLATGGNLGTPKADDDLYKMTHAWKVVRTEDISTVPIATEPEN